MTKKNNTGILGTNTLLVIIRFKLTPCKMTGGNYEAKTNAVFLIRMHRILIWPDIRPAGFYAQNLNVFENIYK
jgi:hypothetical protein